MKSVLLSMRLATVIGLGRSNPRSSRTGLRYLGRPFRDKDPFVAIDRALFLVNAQGAMLPNFVLVVFGCLY